MNIVSCVVLESKTFLSNGRNQFYVDVTDAGVIVQ